MTEKESSNYWQASIGNHAGLTRTKPAANSLHDSPLPSRGGVNKVVLLVDSDPGTRESRARALRRMGVIVHPAANAATARARFANSKFDLVLVDLGPDTKGAESLVAEIKLKDRKQRVAFLVGKPLYLASSLERNVAEAPPVVVSSKGAVAELKEPELTDFGKRIKDAEAGIAI